MKTQNTVTRHERMSGKRGVTEMERMQFISMLAREKDINVSQYTKDAVAEAVARELSITPDLIRRLEMSDRDVMELVGLVCRDGRIQVSDFIRDAVHQSVANDICISTSRLSQVFNAAESWEPSWC